MPNLKIYNFGPIKNAEFDFKKVNVLIGQQGTGKSCVLKIMAFCLWLEKIYLSGEITDLQRDMTQKKFVEKYLLEFYELEDFVNITENGYATIKFDDEGKVKIFIDFKINNDKLYDIEVIDVPLTSIRVAYIPAERSLVSAIPNLMELKLRDTNVYKYLVDWENAHKAYSEKSKFNILGLNADFYYDTKVRADYLFIDDDNKVLLSNAASGFKSVVPICILTQYYINGGNYITIKDKQRVEELKKLIEHFYSGQDDVIKNINGNINSIISNRNCNIFLEEPEANIFPETQFQLVKWLIASLENGHNNTLSIATHSPYILTVLNNLIYAAKVGKKFPEKINKIISKKMWLPTENVAAYYLNDGTAMNIVDDELGEIDPELIDRISQVINHEYGTIRNIEYERDERRRTA